MQNRFLVVLGMLATAGVAHAAPAFQDGPWTETKGRCISAGAGEVMTTLVSKVGYVVDPAASPQIPQLNQPVYVHAFASNTACPLDNATVDFLFTFPPGTTLATDAAPVRCVITGNLPATACFQSGQQLSNGSWRFGTHVGLRPGENFEVMVPVRFTQKLTGAPLSIRTTSDWSPTGVDSTVSVFAPFQATLSQATPFPQPTPPSGTRGDDLVLIGSSLTDAGTLPVAFSADDGSFVVTNHDVGDFAAWSRTPGVQRLTGDFNGDGRTDVALVGGPGWLSIPTAMSNPDGRFTITNAFHTTFGMLASSPGVTALTGDFDRDGDTDIALVGGASFSSIPLALSRRDGTYDIKTVTIPNFPGWAATPGVKPIAGDFNRDGMTDIALIGGAGWASLPVAFSYGNGDFDVANPNARIMVTTTGPGDIFISFWNFAADAAAPNVKVVTGDFNRDGHTDIALVGGAGWSTIKIAMGRNDRSWSYFQVPLSDPSFAGWAASPGVKVLTGDFNRDGATDIALTGVAGWNTVPVASAVAPGGFSVSFNVTNRSVVMPGVGDFGSWASTPGVRAVVGDYNGDGYSDIALTGGAGWGSIPVALGVGSGMFAIINRGTSRFPVWASDSAATVVSGRFN